MLQKKATRSVVERERHEQLKKEREEQERAAKKKEQEAPKTSKPQPVGSPFQYFKDDNKGLGPEELKEKWAALSEQDKGVYKLKVQEDKKRYQEEMEKWKEVQVTKQQQQASKKGKVRQ
eukprot:TRINITY_DN13464_c0_g1_i2.p2 TRINITY_DN13464_c0_g1~~TRINITY_DN13464_c0_g1_i2.p2  ORF type:complete len:119 (-),score=35.13 TRINITY_DN13464_c0_g1_i2:461-817(-)